MFSLCMFCQVAHITCLIVKFRALEFLAHMNRFLMRYKATLITCLIFTLLALEFPANVNSEQLYDYQYNFSWMPDIRIPNIGIFFPHELPGYVA